MVAAPVILSSSSMTPCLKPMGSEAKLPLSTITTELAESFHLSGSSFKDTPEVSSLGDSKCHEVGS